MLCPDLGGLSLPLGTSLWGTKKADNLFSSPQLIHTAQFIIHTHTVTKIVDISQGISPSPLISPSVSFSMIRGVDKSTSVSKRASISSRDRRSVAKIQSTPSRGDGPSTSGQTTGFVIEQDTYRFDAGVLRPLTTHAYTGPVLKAVWYAAEVLGKLVSIGKSNEAQEPSSIPFEVSESMHPISIHSRAKSNDTSRMPDGPALPSDGPEPG